MKLLLFGVFVACLILATLVTALAFILQFDRLQTNMGKVIVFSLWSNVFTLLFIGLFAFIELTGSFVHIGPVLRSVIRIAMLLVIGVSASRKFSLTKTFHDKFKGNL